MLIHKGTVGSLFDQPCAQVVEFVLDGRFNLGQGGTRMGRVPTGKNTLDLIGGLRCHGGYPSAVEMSPTLPAPPPPIFISFQNSASHPC